MTAVNNLNNFNGGHVDLLADQYFLCDYQNFNFRLKTTEICTTCKHSLFVEIYSLGVKFISGSIV